MQSPNAASQPELVGKAVPIFALLAHAGCVRALSCGGELLVSGGSEHTIGVYNVRKRREYGKLLQQDGGGALNCLRFHGRTHMISAGDDGEICIWRTSDWECLLRLKGHKGPVLDLAIHPSGRIALSVGNDKKLMLWNLTTGKCNYTSSLPTACKFVRWTPSGDAYVVASTRSLSHIPLAGGHERKFEQPAGTQLLCGAFESDGVFVSGSEDGALRLWDLRAETVEAALLGIKESAHASRVKAVERVMDKVIATASTNGELKVWRVITTSVQLLVSLSTRLRVTSLATTTFGTAATIATARTAPSLKKRKDSSALATAEAKAKPGSEATTKRANAAKRKSGPEASSAASAADTIHAERGDADTGAVDLTSETSNGAGRAPLQPRKKKKISNMPCAAEPKSSGRQEPNKTVVKSILKKPKLASPSQAQGAELSGTGGNGGAAKGNCGAAKLKVKSKLKTNMTSSREATPRSLVKTSKRVVSAA